MPGEARYTLRIALTDGREITSATSVQYVDDCPAPVVRATLAAAPTGRIAFTISTPTLSEFFQGTRPAV